MTEPYDKAAAGQPITALRWNNLQTAIRDEIEGLKADKLEIAGGTVTGTLVVQRPANADLNKVNDSLQIRGAGNHGLRIETGTTPADVAAVRFQHGDTNTGWIATWLNGRMSFSNQMHLLAGRLGIGIDAPQQELHVRGRVMVDGGVIQTPGPSIVGTVDLGLYSQTPNGWLRLVTNNGPVRFFSDAGIGGVSNLDVVPNGDLKVRRFVTAAGIGLGTGVDVPQDAVHLGATAGNLGIRLQNGAGANDWNSVRFVHGGTERAFMATHGATGRWTVNHVLNVLNGRVGVGPGTDVAIGNTLEVRGDLQVGRPGATAGLVLNNIHSGWSNGGRDRAEISVDPGQKALMIVGSISAAEDDPANYKWPGLGRRVQVWDRLEVNGHLWSQTFVVGPGLGPSWKPTQPIHTTAIAVENGVIQRGGTPLQGVADLGLYSQVPSNWIRIVTNNGLVTFRSDGGFGNVSNVDIFPAGDLKVRRWAIAAALGIGIDTPADLAHLKGTGNVGLRIETGATASDLGALRFFHGAAQTGYLAVTNTGRFTINDAVYVQGTTLGVGTVPGANLHVKTTAGTTNLRIDAGNAANDVALLQFVQGGNQRAALYTNNGGLNVDTPALTVNAATTVTSSLTVKNGAITPAIGNSAAAGIEFPINPGGGGGDEAFIRYNVETGETTTFRIGVANDADDSLRLFQYGADRLIIQNGQVTIGNGGVPYPTNKEARAFNAEAEMKSFGGGAGYRMSDRAASDTTARDWVIYANNYRLNFWQGEVGELAFLSKTRQTLLNSTNPLNFTQGWEGSTDSAVNVSEISNDTGGYKCLMIVGNRSGGTRRVGVWDRLDIYGSAFVNGATILASDRSLKTDIEPLRGALARALELRPVAFTWTKSGARDIGLIAQEVEPVLPELVTVNETRELGGEPKSVKGLQYNGIAVVAVAAVQELAREVASLRRELAELRERIA